MSEPSWLQYARRYNGVKEIPGPRNSETIMGWISSLAKKLGNWIKNTLPDDETPWCGTFVAYVMDARGWSIPKSFMSAKSWLTFGRGLATPAPGAILVFTRNGGGHVGFYVRETPTHYIVFGGNQSNMVNETAVAKTRLAGIRWPEPTTEQPTGRVTGSQGKAKVTTNEA